MKKIALITHSFYEKTKSALIYIDEIFNYKQKFEIDVFYKLNMTNHISTNNVREQKYYVNCVKKLKFNN